MGSEQLYSRGDWVVHRDYGVGQVKGKDVMKFEGKEVDCYKVKTKNSTYWLPVDKIPNSRIRPIVSPLELKRVIMILKRKPREMDSDYKIRSTQISSVETRGSLEEVSELIRDLAALKTERGLTITEERAYERLTNRLITEWAACMKGDIDDIRQELFNILHTSY
jgi:CarD family transcriptional regulator